MTADPARDVDDGDDGAPYDDPISRTRMAWLRTLLICSLIGLLLTRAAYVRGQEWLSMVWLAPSGVLVVVGLTRMRHLALQGVQAVTRRPTYPAWATLGLVVIALAAVAVTVP